MREGYSEEHGMPAVVVDDAQEAHELVWPEVARFARSIGAVKQASDGNAYIVQLPGSDRAKELPEAVLAMHF